jgi:hypothetical protein
MNKGVMNLVIKAIDNATPALRKIGKGFGALKGVATTAFTGIAAASAAVAAALIGFGIAAVKAALDDERSTLRLNAALKARGILTEGLSTAIDKQIESMAALGIEDDQVRAGIEYASRFWTKQADILAVNAAAADVAAVTGMDLADVIDIIGKGARGSTRGLIGLGITVKKGAKLQDILTATTEKYGGIAAEIADSTSGRLASAQIRFNEAIEEFGYRLMPILEDALAWLSEEGLPAFEAGLNELAPIVNNIWSTGIIPLIKSVDDLAISLGFSGGAFEAFGATLELALKAPLAMLQAMKVIIDGVAGAVRFFTGAPDPNAMPAAPGYSYAPAYPGGPVVGGGFQLSVAIGSGSVDGVIKDSVGRIIGTTVAPR